MSTQEMITVEVSRIDSNNDGYLESHTVTLLGVTYNMLVRDRSIYIYVENLVRKLYNAGAISLNDWTNYTNQTTYDLLRTWGIRRKPEGYEPLGSFVESTKPVLAWSIADKTFRILNNKGVGLTAAQLLLMDADKNGALSGEELQGLSAWSDLNEDGIRQADTEVTNLNTALFNAGKSSLTGVDLDFYTRGNARYLSAAPPHISSDTLYNELRNNGNILGLSSDGTTLIGTDNNDKVDLVYYYLPTYPKRDPLLLHTILAGSGNDSVGGSYEDDLMFGGSGNDTLNGNGGDDTIHGEDGNDLIRGGFGHNAIFGGSGNDVVFAGSGRDTVFGGDGQDELQGEYHDDILYGGAGGDKLVGQTGDDTLYGGEGNDVLLGFTGSNESKQTLGPGESDNDFLYGGSGDDYLIGGLGVDYLDGGAGDDTMEGGQGNDFFVVNSRKDSFHELLDAGYDTVISSVSHALGANMEELHLLEGFQIDGRGNSLNNKIFGNGQDNILNGVTGADTLVGGLGNDTYFVDDAGDLVMEQKGQGTDTVNVYISHALEAEVENLVLMDAWKPQRGKIDGEDHWIYGDHASVEVDYTQGNEVLGYGGTCAQTSIANLAKRMGRDDVTEKMVVELAIANDLCLTDPKASYGQRGATDSSDQLALMKMLGMDVSYVGGVSREAVAAAIMSGRGVLIALNAKRLWGMTGTNMITATHMVEVVGVAINANTNAIGGFYVDDSGRGIVGDLGRFVPIDLFIHAATYAFNTYTIVTNQPIARYKENLSATGNALNNLIVGNRGNNTITGGQGNDTLVGQSGDDVYEFNIGDGHDLLIDNDPTLGNNDVLRLNGVSQSQLVFSQFNSDLQIGIQGTLDGLTIAGWYSEGVTGIGSQIERIETADGVLLASQVNSLVQAMASLPSSSASIQLSAVSDQAASDRPVMLAVSH